MLVVLAERDQSLHKFIVSRFIADDVQKDLKVLDFLLNSLSNEINHEVLNGEKNI